VRNPKNGDSRDVEVIGEARFVVCDPLFAIGHPLFLHSIDDATDVLNRPVLHV
jgi:hypothetical protein